MEDLVLPLPRAYRSSEGRPDSPKTIEPPHPPFNESHEPIYVLRTANPLHGHVALGAKSMVLAGTVVVVEFPLQWKTVPASVVKKDLVPV